MYLSFVVVVLRWLYTRTSRQKESAGNDKHDFFNDVNTLTFKMIHSSIKAFCNQWKAIKAIKLPRSARILYWHHSWRRKNIRGFTNKHWHLWQPVEQFWNKNFRGRKKTGLKREHRSVSLHFLDDNGELETGRWKSRQHCDYLENEDQWSKNWHR